MQIPRPLVKYIRILLILLPVIFAVWAYMEAGGAQESSDNRPAALALTSKSEGSAGDDFIAAGELDEFSSAAAKEDDEFVSADDLDEFSPPTGKEEVKNSSSDVFKPCSDSCSSQCLNESVSGTTVKDAQGSGSVGNTDSEGTTASTGLFGIGIDKSQALVMFISFTGVIVSGLLVRRAATRKTRVFFMLGGLLFFGFYLGGCPCPIMGIFKFFQFVRGDIGALPILIWTAGILFLTYFMGKSWCGWLCPIGALQEFIHKPGLSKSVKNRKLLGFLRIARIMIVTFLSLFVLITGVNLLSRLDPFKPVFNLFYGGAETAVWVAVALVVLSAPVIYRPFCKTICPLGLLMGFVSRIPGARRIHIGDTCKDCHRCEKDCPADAISIDGKKREVIMEDCVLCGDCLDKCGHLGIHGEHCGSECSSNEMEKGR